MLPEAGLEGCSFLRGNIDDDNSSRRINAVIHLLFSVFLVQYLRFFYHTSNDICLDWSGCT